MASHGGLPTGLRHLPALYGERYPAGNLRAALEARCYRAGRRIRTSEPFYAVTSGMARQLHGVETLAHAYVIKSVQSYQAEEFNTVNSTDTR